MKKVYIVLMISLFAFAITGNSEMVFGSFEEVEGVSFTHNSNELEINFIDPVKFVGILDGNGYPVSADIIINNKRARSSNIAMYTPNWHLTHTGLATKYELVVQKQGDTLIITEINENGDSYIPLDGFVIAFGGTPVNTYNIGDEITLNGYDFTPAIRAIESDTGKRVLIDAVNSVRSKPMIVYYSSNYGDKTGTNQWGTEITVNLDLETGLFSVGGFRKVGEGSQQGIDIPYYGFVLSAFGDPYRLKLAEGVLFDADDEITVSGIPFVDLEASVSTNYDILNPTIETNPGGMEGAEPFPALRGTDQLIVYTDSWDPSAFNGDGSGTGTNVWGYEIAVDSEGVVVELGINVATIPEGGFVVSGHGIGRDWLRSNAILGSLCEYDETAKTVQLTTTADSYISVIKINRDYAEGLILAAERKLFDINLDLAFESIVLLDTLITDLENVSQQLKATPNEFTLLVEFKAVMDEATKLIDKVTFISYESRVVDSRGIWHRPNNAGYNELTLEGVENFLDDMLTNNINTIYIETFFHGYSISPNMETVTLHPWLAGGDYGEYGNDYLLAFISEAHERGIEVHAWVQNFNMGFDGMVQAPFLETNPEWKIMNDDNTFLQRNEGGQYIFGDPSNPAVTDFLLDHYEELMTEYDFEGLHLDYIRYPVTYRNEDTGFSNHSIDEFKTLQGISNDVNLVELLKTDDDVYQAWVDYKTEKVSSFVLSVVEMVDELDTDKLISTAIFPDVIEATIKKNQNWPQWVKDGWIDITTPMAYYSGASTVESKVKDMVLFVDGITLNYGGIAPAFMGLSVENNPLQAQAVRDGNAYGTVIFASQNLAGYGPVSDSYLLGIHSKEAVLPHADIREIILHLMNDLVGENSKAERIYIPNEKMTIAQKEALQTALTDIANKPYATSEEVEEIINSLHELIDNVGDYGSGFADNRIEDDLLYLAEILEVRYTRLQINEGIWVKPGTVIPDPICEDNEVLVDGECVEEEPVTCEDGFTLVDEECIEDVPEENGNTNKIIIIVVSSVASLGVIGFIVKKYFI